MVHPLVSFFWLAIQFIPKISNARNSIFLALSSFLSRPETKKIFADDGLKITATAVRVPVQGGHSEAVNVELVKDFEIPAVKSLLAAAPGVELVDDVANNKYPMPLFAQYKDAVFVGRVRRDESADRCLNMFIVSDNLRKGAATNAVQIAEYLVAKNMVGLIKT